MSIALIMMPRARDNMSNAQDIVSSARDNRSHLSARDIMSSV